MYGPAVRCLIDQRAEHLRPDASILALTHHLRPFERKGLVKANRSSGDAAKFPPGINVPTAPIAGSITKDYDCATNAHFRPGKPRGATSKSLVVPNPSLSLN
jgi:hypothetical protein